MADSIDDPTDDMMDDIAPFDDGDLVGQASPMGNAFVPTASNEGDDFAVLIRKATARLDVVGQPTAAARRYGDNISPDPDAPPLDFTPNRFITRPAGASGRSRSSAVTIDSADSQPPSGHSRNPRRSVVSFAAADNPPQSPAGTPRPLQLNASPADVRVSASADGWDVIPFDLEAAAAAHAAAAIVGEGPEGGEEDEGHHQLGDNFLTNLWSKRQSVSMSPGDRSNSMFGNQISSRRGSRMNSNGAEDTEDEHTDENPTPKGAVVPPNRTDTFFKARRRSLDSPKNNPLSDSRRSSIQSAHSLSRAGSRASLTGAPDEAEAAEKATKLSGNAPPRDMSALIRAAKLAGVVGAEETSRRKMEDKLECEVEHLIAAIVDIFVPETVQIAQLVDAWREANTARIRRQLHRLEDVAEAAGRSEIETGASSSLAGAPIVAEELHRRHHLLSDATLRSYRMCFEHVVAIEDLSRGVFTATEAAERHDFAARSTAAIETLATQAAERDSLFDAALRSGPSMIATEESFARSDLAERCLRETINIDDADARRKVLTSHVTIIESASRQAAMSEYHDAAKQLADIRQQHAQSTLKMLQLRAIADAIRRVEAVAEPASRASLYDEMAHAYDALQRMAAISITAAMDRGNASARLNVESVELHRRHNVWQAEADARTDTIAATFHALAQLLSATQRVANDEEPAARRGLAQAESASWAALQEVLRLYRHEDKGRRTVHAEYTKAIGRIAQSIEGASTSLQMSAAARREHEAHVRRLEQMEPTHRHHVENEEAADLDAIDAKFKRRLRRIEKAARVRGLDAADLTDDCVTPQREPRPPADGVGLSSPRGEVPQLPGSPSSKRRHQQHGPSTLRSKWDKVLRDLAMVDAAFEVSIETPTPEELAKQIAKARREAMESRRQRSTRTAHHGTQHSPGSGSADVMTMAVTSLSVNPVAQAHSRERSPRERSESKPNDTPGPPSMSPRNPEVRGREAVLLRAAAASLETPPRTTAQPPPPEYHSPQPKPPTTAAMNVRRPTVHHQPSPPREVPPPQQDMVFSRPSEDLRMYRVPPKLAPGHVTFSPRGQKRTASKQPEAHRGLRRTSTFT
jgi:hypothetical protein